MRETQSTANRRYPIDITRFLPILSESVPVRKAGMEDAGAERLELPCSPLLLTDEQGHDEGCDGWNRGDKEDEAVDVAADRPTREASRSQREEEHQRDNRTEDRTGCVHRSVESERLPNGLRLRRLSAYS